MIRSTTDAGSPYYAAFITPGNGVAVQWRATQAGFVRPGPRRRGDARLSGDRPIGRNLLRIHVPGRRRLDARARFDPEPGPDRRRSGRDGDHVPQLGRPRLGDPGQSPDGAAAALLERRRHRRAQARGFGDRYRRYVLADRVRGGHLRGVRPAQLRLPVDLRRRDAHGPDLIADQHEFVGEGGPDDSRHHGPRRRPITPRLSRPGTAWRSSGARPRAGERPRS